MSAITRLSIAIVFFVGMALTIGCGEDNPTVSTPTDTTAANAWVGTGNTQLEAVLMDLINGQNPEKPDDVDLTGPYSAYMKALEADDSNPAANFGAGVLEIIMISQDHDFQDFFDRAKTFMDSGAFFEVPGMAGAPRPGPGLSLRLTETVLPISAVLRMETNMSRAAAAGDPTIGEFQDLLASELIPRLEWAVARLKKITSHPDFKFMITPRMQGDPNEDALELDLTEIYAAITAVDVQLALLNQFCAYSYDMGDWTGNAMRVALTQGSPFMALRSSGAIRMGAAGQAWLDAANSVESGVAFLESETDDQDNDLIKLDHDNDADLDSLKAYIPRVRRALTGQETFKVDFGDGDEDLAIALSAMFNHPVNDLKSLLPAYSVTLDTVESETEYHYIDSQVVAGVEIPTSGVYYWSRYAYYDNGQLQEYREEKSFPAPAWDIEFDRWVAQYSSKSNAYIRISFNGWWLDAGVQNVMANISCQYNESTKWRYSPHITWQANSYAEWIFPNPTVGGLLPGMTDSRLKRIMGFTEEDWQKDFGMGN